MELLINISDEDESEEDEIEYDSGPEDSSDSDFTPRRSPIQTRKSTRLDALFDEVPQSLRPTDWSSLIQLLKSCEHKNFLHCDRLLRAKDSLLDLDAFVGQKKFKDFLADAILACLGTRSHDFRHFKSHWTVEGPPGIGKTTIIKKVAKVLQDLEVLARGTVVMADRQSLIAPYVGQTAARVKKAVKRALGGILVIDEAYALAKDDSFSSVCIDTLNECMSKYANEFLCVFIGYESPSLEPLMQSNQGLRRRILSRLRMDKYTPLEMAQIFTMHSATHEVVTVAAGEAELAQFFQQNANHFPYNGASIKRFVEHIVVDVEKSAFGIRKRKTTAVQIADMKKYLETFAHHRQDDQDSDEQAKHLSMYC